MTAYALGLAFVMLIMACATTLTLMILGVNYYYILGPIAGLAILLPYVGVMFSTIPAVAVAYFQYDMSKALLVLAVYSLLQFLEGNVLTPFIVGGKVRLFPLTVMVAFIFWGLLWGLAGAILAVPLTSAIKVVCENVDGLAGLRAAARRSRPAPAAANTRNGARRLSYRLRPPSDSRLPANPAMVPAAGRSSAAGRLRKPTQKSDRMGCGSRDSRCVAS